MNILKRLTSTLEWLTSILEWFTSMFSFDGLLVDLVPKVCQIRHTFGMAIIDDIYANVDDFGLITSAEARELGVDNQELVRQAHRGKLARVAQGVYRMPVWPYQEAASYAIVVKAAGPDAYLCGESVVALLNLAPTNPNALWVASPRRIRRNLGEGVRVLDRQPEVPTTYYEGVPCQPLEQALRLAAESMGPERVAQAAEEAARRGYLDNKEWERMGRGVAAVSAP